MDPARFVGDVQRLLREPVDGVDEGGKAALVRQQLDLFATDPSLLDHDLRFVPFVPGRRPTDEVRHPGLGSSSSIGLVAPGRHSELVLLFHVLRGGRPEWLMPDDARLWATVDRSLGDGGWEPLVGWDRRSVPLARGEVDTSQEPAQGTPPAMTLRLRVAEDLRLSPAGDDPTAPLGFGAQFSQLLRVRLELEVGGVPLSQDVHQIECFDLASMGSLYRRLIDRLLPLDMERRGAGALPVTWHPWFPVLRIGMEKAELYMRAITGDVLEDRRMLTDPGWLLRVGLQLELLTFLGIAEAVRDEVDLLSPAERQCFERSGTFTDVRDRIDVAAWRTVWEGRRLPDSAAKGQGRAGHVLHGLLRKKTAVLDFLHVHHEDLKQAIELAGPNLVNAQETWHRVFRDAERAVLTRSEESFPELGMLAPAVRGFVCWHERGRFGVSLPSAVTGAFGDQDGLYPTACRQYRESMNEVAEWARARGLMEFTGETCIPRSASLLDAYIAGNEATLQRLQYRDGYEATLEVTERPVAELRLSDGQLADSLARVPLFDVLTVDERVLLAHQLRPIELGPHERIIVQGNPGSSLFVLEAGELEVVLTEAGGERIVATLAPGAVVGEAAFLTGEVRTATVRATTGAVVLEIAPSHLGPLVHRRPALLDELADLMASRERGLRPVGRAGLLRLLVAAVGLDIVGR